MSVYFAPIWMIMSCEKMLVLMNHSISLYQGRLFVVYISNGKALGKVHPWMNLFSNFGTAEHVNMSSGQ